MSTLETGVDPQTFNALSGERRRVFGANFPPQSRLYVFYLPVVLFSFAAAVWLAPTNATFVLGSLVGGLIGLYVLIDILFRNAPLRFTTVYAMTLLMGYNLAAFQSWVTVPRGSLTIAEFFARDPAALARAIAACMASAALLFIVGQLYERPIFGREFRLDFHGNVLFVVIGSTALLYAAYATGQLGFMGIKVGESGHIDPVTELIVWWCIPAFAYSVCATLNTVGFNRWVIGACTLLQAIALVPLGRRWFGFSMLLAVIATRLGRYRNRLSVFYKLLIGALGVLFITAGAVTFLYLRVAGWDQKGQTPLSTRIALAVDLLQKRGPLEVFAMLQTDVSTRFTIGFFSDLLEASQHSTPLLGKDLLYNVQLLVPSVVSPDKFGISPYNEEGMVDLQWGFAYVDEANSLLTTGAADFGIIGVLLYPVLIILFVRVFLELVQYYMPVYVAVIVALGFLFETLQVEDSPSAYFNQARNVLIIAVLFYFLSRLPTFRMRPAD